NRPKSSSRVLSSASSRLNRANRFRRYRSKFTASCWYWKLATKSSANRIRYASPRHHRRTFFSNHKSSTKCRYTLARTGLSGPPCGVPASVRTTTPSCMTPALSHLPIRRRMTGSVGHHPPQPPMIDVIKVSADVGFVEMPHFLGDQCAPQRAHRVVGTASWPKSVRAVQKLRLEY